VTYLPQLKDQLVASRARRRSMRLVAAVAATVLALAGGALAGSGVIEIGSDVEPPERFTRNPDVGPGVSVGRSARLLPLRVPDPAGGPPWGLRLVTTSRGLACVQLGRVVDGKLGVLGQDGIANNDGRFHELSPRFATLSPGCAAPDANGNAFIALDERGLASGEGPRRTCLGPGSSAPGRKRCPVADHRRFLYGLLGPEASGLSYRYRGRVHSTPVTGPEGAYLIVQAERQRRGGVMIASAPSIGHPFTRITYRDGSVCPAPGVTGRDRQCEPGGRRSLLAGLDPDSLRRPLRVELLGRRLVVSFKAPVAVEDARLSYGASAHFDSSCPQIWFVPATNRDVRRGATVELEIELPRRCHGTIRGVVRLTAAGAGVPGAPSGGDPSIAIGRFAKRVPLPPG
jgi:hypothetical protein